MSETRLFPANLELRESTSDGRAGEGLSHKAGGMVLLFVQEMAVAGEPRGAITFVHDAGDHGGRYADLASALADRGWVVSLPDLRGHGRSEGERGHSAGLTEVVRDLGDIQGHLAYMMEPDMPKVLCGQGLGALYALAFAAERPDELAGLVLASPLLEPRFELPRPRKGLMRMLARVGPTSPGSTGFSAEALTSDADHARAWDADELTHDVVTSGAGEQALAAAAGFTRSLETVRAPVLLLQGSEDPLGSPGRVPSFARAGVDVRVFEGLRHDLFHERGTDEVVSALVEWLDAL